MTQNPASTAGPVKETIIRTLDEGAGSVTLSASVDTQIRPLVDT
jgi:hypothetical protein